MLAMHQDQRSMLQVCSQCNMHDKAVESPVYTTGAHHAQDGPETILFPLADAMTHLRLAVPTGNIRTWHSKRVSIHKSLESWNSLYCATGRCSKAASYLARALPCKLARGREKSSSSSSTRSVNS